MYLKTIIYILSAFCILFAIVMASAPGFIDFLNGYDSLELNYLFSFSIAYIGAFLIIAVKFWERKKKREIKRNKVFLIYSPSNIEEAKEINNFLSEMGYDVWFSYESLLPGHVLDKQIQSVLDESGAAILLASDAGLPLYAKKEVDYILKNRSVKDSNFVPIIPVLINSGALPQGLEDVVYVRYEDERLSEKLNKSLAHLVRKVNI